jgi:hypothetical protein
MRVIHKYALLVDRPSQVPKGIVRHVGEQDSMPIAWVEYDRRSEHITMDLVVVATGQEFGEAEHGEFVGTSQGLSGGVWHVFKKDY